MPNPPVPEVKEFARQLAESNEDAVAFYREDGREVLVEVQNKGFYYVHRFEAGEEFGHVSRIDWEEML
jgi:hypothetical protein